MARSSKRKAGTWGFLACAIVGAGGGMAVLRASSESISLGSWLNQGPLLGADSHEPQVLPEPPRLSPPSQTRSVTMNAESTECSVPQVSSVPQAEALSSGDGVSQERGRFRRSQAGSGPMPETLSQQVSGSWHGGSKAPLVLDQSMHQEHQQVTQALITLIKHALKADPSLLIKAYRHIVENLPHASQEPYAQRIVHQLNRKPHVWRQLTQGVKQRCLVVFLDPTCPHSSALFHHLLSLGRSILHNWHIRPFWWSPQSHSRHTYVTKALWLLSIHGLIEPFCRIIEARDLALHHLTPALMQDILESLGINMMQFQEAMSQPMINDVLTQVKAILKELHIQSFPLMICKTSGTGHTQPIATSFRIFQGCPQAKDDIWRWLTQTEDTSSNP